MRQYNCEGISDSSASAGTDVGLGSVCSEQEHCGLCLAVHNLQLTAGDCMAAIIISISDNYYTIHAA